MHPRPRWRTYKVFRLLKQAVHPAQDVGGHLCIADRDRASDRTRDTRELVVPKLP